MTNREKAHALIEPELDYINGTPELLWGLMDVNLMPEQIRTKKQAKVLLKVVAAYRGGQIPGTLPANET